MINSEFFSIPNTFLIAKYDKIIEIILHNFAKEDVINPILEFIKFNKLTIDENTKGILAVVIAENTVVIFFLFVLFNTYMIIDIIKTLIIGVIADIITDNILVPICENPHKLLRVKLS